jgi:hypothetical protein
MARATLGKAIGCVLAAVIGAACGDDDGPGADAGTDAGRMDGGGVDGGAGDAGPGDGGGDTGPGPDDAGGADGGAVDAGGADGGTADSGGETGCVTGGGECVAVVPDACAGGIVGDPEWYSCGVGVGVLCCLPPATAPVCRRVGEPGEGWVRADGTMVCTVRCAGATAACEAIGTRSEGWYADLMGTGCPAIPVERLIEWTDCSPGAP